MLEPDCVWESFVKEEKEVFFLTIPSPLFPLLFFSLDFFASYKAVIVCLRSTLVPF